MSNIIKRIQRLKLPAHEQLDLQVWAVVLRFISECRERGETPEEQLALGQKHSAIPGHIKMLASGGLATFSSTTVAELEAKVQSLEAAQRGAAVAQSQR